MAVRVVVTKRVGQPQQIAIEYPVVNSQELGVAGLSPASVTRCRGAIGQCQRLEQRWHDEGSEPLHRDATAT